MAFNPDRLSLVVQPIGEGGKMLIGIISGTATSITILDYNNGSPLGSDGQIIQVSGMIEITPI